MKQVMKVHIGGRTSKQHAHRVQINVGTMNIAMHIGKYVNVKQKDLRVSVS